MTEKYCGYHITLILEVSKGEKWWLDISQTEIGNYGLAWGEKKKYSQVTTAVQSYDNGINKNIPPFLILHSM